MQECDERAHDADVTLLELRVTGVPLGRCRRYETKRSRARGTTAPAVVPGVGVDDIRRRLPLVLVPAGIVAAATLAARLLSLVAVDLLGLTAGVYSALVLRELWIGASPSWDGLWQTAADWLGFLALVTVLVFAQAGLYAPRDRRPGFPRIASSVVLVGLLALAFAIGTDFEFHTYGIVPTSIVLTPSSSGRCGSRTGRRSLRWSTTSAFGAGSPWSANADGIEPLLRALSGAAARDRYRIVATVPAGRPEDHLPDVLGRQFRR